MRPETPDVNRPQIHRRFAADNPLGQRTPRAAIGRDAIRVEAGTDKKAAHFRRLAENKTAVRRKGFRPVDELANTGVFQRGHATGGLQK